MRKLRAEFYTAEGQPFMVGGKHATKSDLTEFPDHLYIMTARKVPPGCIGITDPITHKFARLAVSTDGQVGLYVLSKVREWETQGSA